jgi:hypothetical protein
VTFWKNVAAAQGAAFSSIGISNEAGATWPSFHASNDSLTLALPFPASLGTRTGP